MRKIIAILIGASMWTGSASADWEEPWFESYQEVPLCRDTPPLDAPEKAHFS